MRALIPLIPILASLGLQAADVVYRGDLTPLNIVPTFDHRYLAVYQWEHAIDLYGPDGKLAYQAKPQVAQASWLNPINASADSDGSLAIAVEYRIERREGGGIAVFDPEGKQIAFIGDDTWAPTQVCFDQDHTIWAIGWKGLNPTEDSPAEYYVLRHFSRDGRLLGAFLPRSTFEQDPVGPIVGGWQIRSANGRVGMLFYASSVLPMGTQRRSPQWVETDLDGNVATRIDLTKKTVVAFPGDGTLYAREYEGGYMNFDPLSKTWRKFSPPPGTGSLLGADGNSLVFMMQGGSNWVSWSPRN